MRNLNNQTSVSEVSTVDPCFFFLPSTEKSSQKIFIIHKISNIYLICMSWDQIYCLKNEQLEVAML